MQTFFWGVKLHCPCIRPQMISRSCALRSRPGMVVTVPSFWTACHGLGRARQWRRWCLSARLCSAVLWKFIDDGMRRQTAASTATTCKIKGERPWVYLPQAQNKKSDLSPAPNRVTMLSPAGKILQFYSLLLSHCSYPKLVLLHGSFWAALALGVCTTEEGMPEMSAALQKRSNGTGTV